MKNQPLAVLIFFLVSASAVFGETDKECRLLSSPNTGATSIPALTQTPGSLSPNEEVKSLEVQIDTSKGIFTGTTDDVWLDLGPRAWKIGDDFGAGTSKVMSVGVNWVGSPLLVRDLVWVRLEKKGICGLTNAPDSLLDLVFPGGATPANLLPSAREKVEELARDVEVARTAVAAHEKLVKAENDLISASTTEINRLESLKTDVATQIISVNAQIDNKALELQKGAVHQFENVEEHYTDVVCSTWGKVLFGPAVCLFHKAVDRTRVVQRVTQAYLDATNTLQRLRTTASDLQSKVLNFHSQIQQQANNRAAHLAHLANLESDVAATKTLDTVETGLARSRRASFSARFVVPYKLLRRSVKTLPPRSGSTNKVMQFCAHKPNAISPSDKARILLHSPVRTLHYETLSAWMVSLMLNASTSLSRSKQIGIRKRPCFSSHCKGAGI